MIRVEGFALQICVATIETYVYIYKWELVLFQLAYLPNVSMPTKKITTIETFIAACVGMS